MDGVGELGMRWRAAGVGALLALALAVLCQEATIDRFAGYEIGFDPYGVALIFTVVAASMTQLWAGARGAGRSLWAGLVLIVAVTLVCAWQVAENEMWALSVVQVAGAGVGALAQVMISRTGRRFGNWTLGQALIGSLAFSAAFAWGLTVWEDVRTTPSSGGGDVLLWVCLIAAAVIGCFVAAYLLVRLLPTRRRGWVSTLAGSVLCVALAAVFSIWMHRLQPVSWALAGVGPGSRSLTVTRLARSEGCADETRARVVSRDAGHIRLEVRARPDTNDCDVGSGGAHKITVALTTPLHGEAIVGDHRQATQPAEEYRRIGAISVGRIYRVMPRVTGLRPNVARALLGIGAARTGALSIVRGPIDNEVIAQSPAPGALLGSDLTRHAERRWSRTPIQLTTN